MSLFSELESVERTYSSWTEATRRVTQYCTGAKDANVLFDDYLLLKESSTVSIALRRFAIYEIERHLMGHFGSSGVCTILEHLRFHDLAIFTKHDLYRLASFAGTCSSANSISLLNFCLDKLGDDTSELICEWCACIIQEIVLRGIAEADAAHCKRWEKVRGSAGSLGWLPITRSSLETKIRFPREGYHVSKDPCVPKSEFLYHISNHNQDCKSFSDIGILNDLASPRENCTNGRMCESAFSNWISCDSCHFEINCDLENTIEVDRVLSHLGSAILGLANRWQKGEEVLKQVSVRRIEPTNVVRCLHCSSAYSGGSWLNPPRNLYGAWGRYFAWKSLAGFLSLDDSSTFAQIDSLTKEASWFSFYFDANFDGLTKFAMGCVCRSRAVCLCAWDDLG